MREGSSSGLHGFSGLQLAYLSIRLLEEHMHVYIHM